MDSCFPAGFPFASQVYLVLFVVTMVLHVLFMNYVLAGSAWMAWARLRGLSGQLDQARDPQGPAASETVPVTGLRLLADWLPAMLSGAITAGVAPLLLVQILYQKEFYTANLLLFHRWMAILPVLIVGFYALYLGRTDWVRNGRGWLRIGVGVLPFACIGFVAYSWTENHLLSLQGSGEWREFYRRGTGFYWSSVILPRLWLWAVGAWPTLAWILASQLSWHRSRGSEVGAGEFRRLARAAWIGLVAVVAGGVWYSLADSQVVRVALSPLARLYLAGAVVGGLVQGFLWWRVWKSDRMNGRLLGGLAAGWLATVTGMTVFREALRLDRLGAERWSELTERHAAAWQVEGFGLFLAFALLNTGLIGFVFWIVRTQKRNAVERPPPA